MPLATSTGADHCDPSWRETQMPTSGSRSRVPPNQAAANPPRVSTIVDAWADGNGARSKMNSDRTIEGDDAWVAETRAERTTRMRSFGMVGDDTTAEETKGMEKIHNEGTKLTK